MGGASFVEGLRSIGLPRLVVTDLGQVIKHSETMVKQGTAGLKLPLKSMS